MATGASVYYTSCREQEERREYAQKAGEILLAYADRYAGYPLHDINGNARVGGGRIMAQTLDESVWLIPLAFGYALVRETMPDAARAHVEKDLLVAAADVIRSHKMGIHNIQCWKNSAVGLAGLAANNEALVREAIDDPQRGFRVQIARGITDDGLWYEGSFIPTASVIMKNAGFAMLRADGNAIAIRFGKHGGGHGHPDKLNIVTYAAGHLFGLDAGSINYGVPLHREWYRATIAHNTVAVDGKNQSNVDGQLEQWSEASISARVDAYRGVTLRRTLRLEGSTLQDRFECSSGAEHDYDYAFHAVGEFGTSLGLKARGPLGYLHVEKVSEARPSGDWWAEWEQGRARWRLNVKGVPGTTVYTGVGPGRTPADRVPLVIVRRHGKETVYDCTREFSAK